MSDKTLAEQAAEVRGAFHMVWKALYRTVGGAVFNSRLKHAPAKPVDTSPSTLKENGENLTRERVEAESEKRYPDHDWDHCNSEPIDDYGYGECARAAYITGRTVSHEETE